VNQQGHVSTLATLEWRLHHHNLGVETVHWYARDASVQTWVDSYNAATGAKDTFVHAPPILLDHYGHSAALGGGFYLDQVSLAVAPGLFPAPDLSLQVMYYQDCKLRSLHERPTQYLAYIDRDEFIYPSYLLTPRPSWTPLTLHLSQLPLNSFMSAYFSTMEPDTGSACFRRELQTGPPISLLDLVSETVGSTEPTQLAWLSHLGKPASEPKCVHAISGCDVGAVQ
jgi:hypothetical protein